MNIQLELEKAQHLAQQHQQEVERLRVKIRELEEELKRQKDQYLRKSSTKAVI
jgi:molecular chaperone GrpE (heat shock protein)